MLAICFSLFILKASMKGVERKGAGVGQGKLIRQFSRDFPIHDAKLLKRKR